MKTALRKDQTRRPSVKSKRASKSGNKVATKSPLDAALKLYYEFTRNKDRNKITSNAPTIGTKGSKASGSSDSCSSGNQNFQYTPNKISICPIKRTVDSLEMGM